MSRLSRRTFLKSSAAAASLAVSARVVSGAPGANERIAAAVIGCRNRGWQVARAFHGSKRFDILTVCDCDDAMIAQGMSKLNDLPAKIDAIKDFRKIIDNPKVNAVVVATPDHWHALMSVMALEAGKHIYVEKPFAFNIDDGKAIVAAQRRHPKLVVQVGTQQRSGTHFLEAREFVRSGGLGKIGFCRCWQVFDRGKLKRVPDSDPPTGFDYDMWVGPAPFHPYNEEKVHYNWHHMRDYGSGDTGNWGAHWMDSARQILDLDLPTAAAGFGRKIVDDPKEWPDTETVVFQFPQLTMLWELRQWTRHAPQQRGGGVQIDGDAGSLIIDRGGWWFHPMKGEPVAHKPGQMEEPHVLNFADCIAGQAKPNAPAEEGQKSAILCHLSNITSTFNCRVDFEVEKQMIVGNPEAKAMMGREYRAPWRMEA